MVAIFATGKAKNSKIYNVLDPKLNRIWKSFTFVIVIKFSKQIVVDGEGAKKFITINVVGGKIKQTMAKNIGFQLQILL